MPGTIYPMTKTNMIPMERNLVIYIDVTSCFLGSGSAKRKSLSDLLPPKVPKKIRMFRRKRKNEKTRSIDTVDETADVVSAMKVSYAIKTKIMTRKGVVNLVRKRKSNILPNIDHHL